MKKIIKLLFISLIATSLCFSLVACGNNEITEDDMENALNSLDGKEKGNKGECDPFESLSVTFKGTSPNGEITIENKSGSVYYSPSKTNNLKNGDKVIVKASSSKYELTKTEEEYTVNGLPEYIEKLSQITEEINKKLEENSNKIIREDEKKWDEGNKIKDMKFIGCYLLTSKPENIFSTYNIIYYVFKINSEVKGLKRGGDGETQEIGHETYYTCVEYKDLVLLEDGKCSVDIGKGKLTNNIIESDYGYENFGPTFYNYNGYKDLDSMFSNCVTKQIDNYGYETNIKEK